jgi:hypothetical protein
LQIEKATIHGDTAKKTTTLLYRVWGNMLDRCRNPDSKNYTNYMGRGINVDPTWEDYEVFKKWALENNYQKGLQIDRIDNNQGYSPLNFKWSTPKEQAKNRRPRRLSNTKEKGEVMGEHIAKIIGITFMSRTMTHIAHFETGSYAAHKALDDFYSGIIDLADGLAEAAMGKYGKIKVPFMNMTGSTDDIVGALESHMVMIENLRKKCDAPYLDSMVQVMQELYSSTLYKLRELA